MMAMSNVGRFDFEDGDTYAGSWCEGMATGLGAYRADSNQYAGSWRAGFEECGVYRWFQGNFYEGQWLQGRRHGLGVEKVDGWLYKGEWTQGFRGRYGLRQSLGSGAKYEGSWIFGRQDGYGVETYADGGTYQGQWLRGLRHGHGVRQSVSYDLALRYHAQFKTGSSISGTPQKERPPIQSDREPRLLARDRRIQGGRPGGFILGDHTLPDDRRGKSSLRGALKFVRKHSTGDIEERGHVTRGARTAGGSVRSTSSTRWGGFPAGSEDEMEDGGARGSFMSLVNVSFPEDVVERYWGEWKDDKRSGYGVCERSDGIRYEGEWFDNMRNGYGVTTLRDGTRLEGKYRKNLIVTDAKRFSIRTGRLKELVQRAVLEAEKAAKIAREKAEIADARTLGARVKAEQAQTEAERAESLAEAAIAQAQKCQGNVVQPGVQIVLNRLREEELLIPADEPEVVVSGHDTFKSRAASKFLSLLRSKKRPSLGKAFPHDLPSLSPEIQNTAKLEAKSSTRPGLAQFGVQPGSMFQPVPTPYTSMFVTQPAGGVADVWIPSDVHQGFGIQDGSSRVPFRHGDAILNQDFEGKQEYSWGTFDSRDQRVNAIGVSSETVQPADAISTFNKHRQSEAESAEYQTTSGRRRAHAQIDTERPLLSYVNYSSDSAPPEAVNADFLERRKSLPSIVKDADGMGKGKATPEVMTSTKPEVIRGIRSPVEVNRETFVIEDGIRKRVTPVYGANSPVRALAVEGRPGLPKLYQIDSSSENRDRSSVPDLSGTCDLVGLPREAVRALSEQRRHEMLMERLEAEKRGGQIVLRLGDVTDWCARRKMLIVVLAVNYALVTVFYSMLQQQN